jgi:signal transduction histidine kinase
MKLAALSNDDLAQTLRTLEQQADDKTKRGDCQDVGHDLHVHQIELEMQNRALRDIQAELEVALVRYTDLYDHLPIGYLTLTPHGQIAEANLTAARWLRRDRDQLTGVYINWFLDAFDAGRFAAHLDQCAHSGQEQNCEVTLRLDNGLSLTVQLASRVTPWREGSAPQIHTAMTNVSKLKQARAVIGDIEHEENAVTGLAFGDPATRFSSVSHFARSLLTEHRASLTPEALEVAERLECAALRVEETLQHLVDYCSVGREGVALDPVSLEELAQQVVIEHRVAIKERGATVEIQRPLPCVRGSRLILAHVLANLLINAVRFPPADQSRRITLSAEKKEGHVILTLAHDGLRLPASEKNYRVFERLHGARHFLPDGIGFALVRYALERMEGRLWFESDPYHGNCFKVELRQV